jgi:hypothetical protein
VLPIFFLLYAWERERDRGKQRKGVRMWERKEVTEGMREWVFVEA